MKQNLGGFNMKVTNNVGKIDKLCDACSNDIRKESNL